MLCSRGELDEAFMQKLLGAGCILKTSTENVIPIKGKYRRHWKHVYVCPIFKQDHLMNPIYVKTKAVSENVYLATQAFHYQTCRNWSAF